MARRSPSHKLPLLPIAAGLAAVGVLYFLTRKASTLGAAQAHADALTAAQGPAVAPADLQRGQMFTVRNAPPSDNPLAGHYAAQAAPDANGMVKAQNIVTGGLEMIPLSDVVIA